MQRITTTFEMDVESCPFCGEEQDLKITKGVDSYWVECNSCGADGPLRDLPNEAIEIWNKRSAKK
jgi:Lar family restriction alleviation protein